MGHNSSLKSFSVTGKMRKKYQHVLNTFPQVENVSDFRSDNERLIFEQKDQNGSESI